MCFISPKNVERKLENKEKKSNSKDSVTKLCFTADITGQRKILRGISDKILSLCETNESSAIMETNGYRLFFLKVLFDYFNISDVKER